MSDAGHRLRIAVDIGGTFTDLAAFDEKGGTLSFGKALSTHQALAEGIQHTLAGAGGVEVVDAYLFLHGTTIAINTPSEHVEAKFPVVIERYELRQDSGGAGRRRGGLGADYAVTALVPMQLNTRIERKFCRPWGLYDGGDGAGNAIELRTEGKWQDNPPNAKLVAQRLKKGDGFMIRSGGGGGFGDPHELPAERVAFDVVEGYISAEAAATDYGVVVDAATGIIDQAATAKLRAGKGKAS